MDRKMIDLSGSFSLTTYLPSYHPTYLSICLSIHPSIYLSLSLSIYLSIYLSIPLSLYLSLSIYLPIYLSTYLPIYLSTYLPIYLPTYLSIYLSLGLSVGRSVCLSVYLQAWKPGYSTRLLHFSKLTTSIFWSWPHQKRSNSARLLQFLNLTTSKTKQFCETSHFWTWQHPKRSNSARLRQFLNLTTSKTKQFYDTSFKNGKLTAELTAACQCVLRFSQSICLNYCACHEKVMPCHTKCCTCHAKSSQQTWKSEAPKCNPSQEISALTSEQLRWRCLLCCACHGKCIFADPLQMSHACHRALFRHRNF